MSSILAAGLLLLATGTAVNVADFGAKGDGVTDDTAAIQRAADALNGPGIGREANCLSGCGKRYVDGPYPAVVFPAGTYRVTGPVVFTGNVKLLGEDGAKVVNATKDKETFYVRDNHRLVVENLAFEGGSVQVRQWTRNRDVSYLKVSGCTFSGASDTALVSVSYKWYKGEKKPGNPAEENVEAVRGPDGLYTLTSRGPLADFTAYNNSTLILVERSAFRGNATAFWGYSDGLTIRDCEFTAPEGSIAPQLRLGNGGRLGVEIYARNVTIRYPGAAVPGRAAIAFEGGRVLLEDSSIVADADLVGIRSTSRVNEYGTASSLGLRNVTFDTGSAPVVSLPGPSFPNRLYASGVRTTQPVRGKKLYAFEVEPDAEFVKGIPLRDPADNYKGLTGVPTENCCTIVREDVDERTFDVTLPEAIRFLETRGPGTLRKEWGGDVTPLCNGGSVFSDASIGRARRDRPGDDTEKVAALLAQAKAVGGGRVELPARWITMTRTLELPDKVHVFSKGCAAIEMTDRESPAFVIPEGADVSLNGVLFSGGGSAIATTAVKGSLTLVDCGFTDFRGPAVRAESSVPRGFRIRMTGGNSYTAQLYRGNADVTVDCYWFECCPPATTADETPFDFATIVNAQGGRLRMRDFLGVPVYFGHFTKACMSDPKFERERVGDYRWIDNRGELFCKNVRFGGEFRGLTAVYAYGDSRTYIDGGVNETSSEVMRPGRNCIVACDSEACDVTVVDVLAHTYRTAQLAKVKAGDAYRPFAAAKYSNNFPFRLTNDVGTVSESLKRMSPRMTKETLIAHRGHVAKVKGRSCAPENTLASFTEAVNLGFGFECDILLSKDNRVFTMHDGCFRRCFGIDSEDYREMTWDYISKLVPIDPGGVRHPETRPALFEEVCGLVRDGRMVFVEVKTGPEIVPHVKRILAGQTKANPKNLLFISFNKDAVRTLKKELPEYKAMLLLYSRHAWPQQKELPDHSPYTAEQCLAELKGCGADGLDFHFDAMIREQGKAFVRAIRAAGYEFHYWVVDDLDGVHTAFANGAQTVTTNRGLKHLKGEW